MKKKLFLLVIILLFVSGCEGTYDIELYNDKVIEKVSNLYLSSEVVGDPYEYTKEISLKYSDNGDFFSYQNKKNIKTENKIGTEIINEYDSIDEYVNNSKLVRKCYIAQNVTHYEDDYITIKTSNEFLCLGEVKELDKVTIKISSNHKLKETNADEIRKNTYYWYIDKDNYKEKPLSLMLYSDKYVWNYNNEVLKRLVLIILVIGGTVIIATIVYKLYQEKEKENF